jgi:hypothetical protein
MQSSLIKHGQIKFYRGSEVSVIDFLAFQGSLGFTLLARKPQTLLSKAQGIEGRISVFGAYEMKNVGVALIFSTLSHVK